MIIMDETFEPAIDRYMHDFQDNDDDGDEGSGLWSVNSNCTYYDIDDVNSLSDSNNCYQHTALHLNIHSLPSKHEQLRAMISDLLDSGIVINYILLCETFLTDTNCALFQLLDIILCATTGKVVEGVVLESM